MNESAQGPGFRKDADERWYPPAPPPPFVAPTLPPQSVISYHVQGQPTPTGGKRTKPWWRRWWAIAIGVILAIGIIGAIAGPRKDTDAADEGTSVQVIDDGEALTDTVVEMNTSAPDEAETANTVEVDSVATDPAAPTAVPETVTPATVAPTTPATEVVVPSTAAPTTAAPVPVQTQPDPASSLTPSQQNAVRAAESYLDFSGFSRQGLIGQLSSEYGDKFPVEDATVAVDSLNVDWTAEAVESAQSYLGFSGFSRKGLIDQLSSEHGDQFTIEQATFAVDSVNADWNAEAAESAQSYLSMSGFSCQGLIDQLSSEYGDQFTIDEARYGASQAGIC